MNKDMNKDLKDSSTLLEAGSQGMSFIGYPKTDKLITALYMVTDIIDKEEPIRNKLRTFGTEILSDTISMTRFKLIKNIQGVLSFLDIAFTMNMISEMNKNILINEFTQLKNSIITSQDNPVWLEEFLREDKKGEKESLTHNSSIGHSKHTRIGVQKGSTLMRALSDKTNFMSDRKDINASKNNPVPYKAKGFRSGFNMLKKQRRDNIMDIIKNNRGNSTIKDIKVKINTGARGLLAYSEKTLQRELISMVKDGVLFREGSKRWSKYFIKN